MPTCPSRLFTITVGPTYPEPCHQLDVRTGAPPARGLPARCCAHRATENIHRMHRLASPSISACLAPLSPFFSCPSMLSHPPSRPRRRASHTPDATHTSLSHGGGRVQSAYHHAGERARCCGDGERDGELGLLVLLLLGLLALKCSARSFSALTHGSDSTGTGCETRRS